MYAASKSTLCRSLGTQESDACERTRFCLSPSLSEEERGKYCASDPKPTTHRNRHPSGGRHVDLRRRSVEIRQRALSACETLRRGEMVSGAWPPRPRNLAAAHSSSCRILVVAVPPVDELDLVGPLQVFNPVNRLAGRTMYTIEVVTNVAGTSARALGERPQTSGS